MAEFENLFEIFGIIQDHVVEHATYYGLGFVLAIPFIYFTRRFSFPVILYSLEIMIYFIIMHTVTTLVTNFFAWLKNQTSMQAIRDKDPDVYWDTPWAYFWHAEKYEPQWLMYMEGTFAAIIIILVIRYRPMKIQKSRKQTEAAKKGEFKPDQISNRQRAQEMARKYSNPENIGKGGKGKRR